MRYELGGRWLTMASSGRRFASPLIPSVGSRDGGWIWDWQLLLEVGSLVKGGRQGGARRGEIRIFWWNDAGGCGTEPSVVVGRLFDSEIGDVIYRPGPMQAELAACPHGAPSELGREAGLLADFVRRDPIKLFVAFDRDYLDVIGVDGVVAALPEQAEAVLLQIPDKVTSLD